MRGVSTRNCEDPGPKPAETLAASGRPVYTGVGNGESKRKSRLNAENLISGESLGGHRGELRVGGCKNGV